MLQTISTLPGVTILEWNSAGHIAIARSSAGVNSFDVTANTYAAGCKLIDTQTSIEYINSGTPAAPVWSRVASNATVDPALIQTVTVNLSSAQLLALYDTPVLILAGISGKNIMVDSVDLVVNGTATQYTTGGVIGVQYANTVHGGGTLVHAGVAASVLNNATAQVYCHNPSSVLAAIATASITGVGLYISNQTADFAVGTGTVTVVVRYHLV